MQKQGYSLPSARIVNRIDRTTDLVKISSKNGAIFRFLMLAKGFPTGLNGVTGGQITVGPGMWSLWSPIPVEVHGGGSYTVGPTLGANNGGCP